MKSINWNELTPACYAIANANDVDLAEENDAFNVWIRKRQANVKALAALWNAKDYQGMVELMENAADPGPINGEKPSDHE